MHRERLPIPKPCPADWRAMSGDERQRFCGSCNKHVHDLSAMTEPEAEALVSSGRDLCVRYSVQPDGRVRHAPPRGSVRGVVRAVALGLALASTPALAVPMVRVEPEPETPPEPSVLQRVARWLQEQVRFEPPPVLMGEIAPPEPPPVQGKLAPTPPSATIPEVSGQTR